MDRRSGSGSARPPPNLGAARPSAKSLPPPRASLSRSPSRASPSSLPCTPSPLRLHCTLSPSRLSPLRSSPSRSSPSRLRLRVPVGLRRLPSTPRLPCASTPLDDAPPLLPCASTPVDTAPPCASTPRLGRMDDYIAALHDASVDLSGDSLGHAAAQSVAGGSESSMTGPSPVRRKVATRKVKQPNFSAVEDNVLCKAWLAVSCDPAVNTGQRKEAF
ncbi:hypothetical protein EJB05_13453, partial [Eragrostis curvula]